MYQLKRVSYKMGENKYSDLTPDECEVLKGLYIPRQKVRDNLQTSPIPNNQQTTPDTCNLDLRKDVCLTGVKDQGECGSCYAFPATALAEFAYCTQNDNTQVSFSEQQCTDCTRRYGNAGCGGGFYEGCFQHWRTSLIQTSNKYPYIARDQRCREAAYNGVTKVTGYATLKSWDEKNMLNTMCELQQPIAVSIDATDNFNNYKSGIFDDRTCNNYLINKSTSVNHAVTLVGAGVDAQGSKYWILRNSWGTSWGEGGYMRIKRGVNMCNIALDPVVIDL